MTKDYTPIACSVWDEWELAILKAKPVTIRFHDESEALQTISARPTDLITRNKAEYLVVEYEGAPMEIRLDRLVNSPPA